MAKPQSKRRPQRRRERRLFQSDSLTAVFGRSVATMTTRIVLSLATVGVLVFIGVGLLTPKAASTDSATSSSSASVGLQVGNTAPNFTLTALDGKQVSLNDYRGKPVQLNFWFAACPGCLIETPGMVKFYNSQQTAGKDFVILGVNSVDNLQTAQQFVREKGVAYTMALDDNQRVATLYSLTATPTSYFINRQGIIRAVVVGPVDDATLQQKVTDIS